MSNPPPINNEEVENLLLKNLPELNKEDLNVVPVNIDKITPEVNIPPPPPPDIKTRTYVDYIFLKEFLEKDFNLDQATLIDLKRKNEQGQDINQNTWFIVFIDESNRGKKFLQTWLELAQIVKSDYLNLGFCNLTFENKVFENFKKLSLLENINHPFNWAKFTEIPYMMVFRNRWPEGFYNGPMNQLALVDFIATKASDALIKLDTKHPRRVDFSNQIFESEKRLEKEELREKAKKEDQKRKEDLKEIDPSKQEISEGVNFLS